MTQAFMNESNKKPLTKRLRQAVKGLIEPDRPFLSPAQFSQLYQEKHLLVFRHIYGLSGGPTSLVEDLTAETFIRAWKARNTFTGSDSAAVGWLLRIARNLVIDHQRNRLEQKTDNFAEDFNQLPAPGLPEEELILAEQQARIIALLQELPPQKREIITLRYLLDWPVKEIADYLEMPENTVSVTIKRSLQQMRGRWPMITIQKEHKNVKI